MSAPKVKIIVWPRFTYGVPLTISNESTDILTQVTIQKDQSPVGTCSFTFFNAYAPSSVTGIQSALLWEELLAPGDLFEIYVDDLLKMVGVLNSVGFTSGISGNIVTHRVAAKGFDLGVYVLKFSQIVQDARFGDATINGIAFAFKKAMNAAKETIAEGTYNVKDIMTKSWDRLVGEYINVVTLLTGPFQFSDRSSWSQRMGSSRLFETVAPTFQLTYPPLTQLSQAQNLWQYWTTLANPPFAEMWTDSCYRGQEVEMGSGGYTSVSKNGFRVFCRPSVWLDRLYDRVPPRTLPTSKIINVTGARSSSEVKTVYLCYPLADVQQSNLMKAAGGYELDKRLFSMWGFDVEEVPLNFVSGNLANTNLIQLSKDASALLRDGYGTIDMVYTGTISMRYDDVRVGQFVRFPKKVGQDAYSLKAYVSSVADSFDYNSGDSQSAMTTLTYVRGDFA